MNSPPLPTGDLQQWAEQLVDYLRRSPGQLPYADTSRPATRDGVLMWDPNTSQPVVTLNGEYRPIALGAAI